MSRMTNGLVLAGCMVLACADAAVYGPNNQPADWTSIVVPNGTTAGFLSPTETPNGQLQYWWDFENESDFLTDVLGRQSANSLSRTPATGDRVAWTDDDKRWGGAVYLNNAYLQLATLPSFINQTGSNSFTVMFWLRSSEASLMESSEGEKDAPNLGSRIFYFGQNKADPSTDNSISLLYNVSTDLMTNKYKFRDTFGAIDVGADFPITNWIHVGVVVMPIAQEDRVAGTNVTFKTYINGVAKRVRDIVFDAGSDPVLLLGSGYGTKNLINVKETCFDNVMIFNRALTVNQINYYANQPHPFEFSAGWDIEGTGSLAVGGEVPQRIRGAGSVAAEAGLTLNGGTDVYGGVISGAGLTVAKDEGAQQVLSGQNAYAGETRVTGGTLTVDPSLTTTLPAFEGSVVAYYPFDDAEHPGHDASGNGNDLSPVDATDVKGGVVWSDGAKAGAIEVDATGSDAKGWKSAGALKGFDAKKDNSYTVGFWMRMDEVVASCGSFCFWNGDGVSYGSFFLKPDSARIYGGDAGEMIYNSLPKVANKMYGEWVHFAYIYDKDSTTKKQILYINGEEKVSSDAVKGFNHGGDPLYIGWTKRTDGAYFDGAIDEFFVLKGAYPGDVEKMMNFRKPAAATAATGVLPTTTNLKVSGGAKAVFAHANETVSGLSGAVEVGAGSTLSVADNGTMGNFAFSGAGTLNLGSSLVWDLPTAKGTYDVGTVPVGFELPAWADTWSIRDCRRQLTWSVTDNVLKVSVIPSGAIFIVK